MEKYFLKEEIELIYCSPLFLFDFFLRVKSCLQRPLKFGLKKKTFKIWLRKEKFWFGKRNKYNFVFGKNNLKLEKCKQAYN